MKLVIIWSILCDILHCITVIFLSLIWSTFKQEAQHTSNRIHHKQHKEQYSIAYILAAFTHSTEIIWLLRKCCALMKENRSFFEKKKNLIYDCCRSNQTPQTRLLLTCAPTSELPSNITTMRLQIYIPCFCSCCTYGCTGCTCGCTGCIY